MEELTMYHLPVFPKVPAAIYYSDHTLSKETLRPFEDFFFFTFFFFNL